MCNNMLQYGHVYAWAREHGRKTISMRFCYKYPYFRISRSRHHNFLTYLFAKYSARCGLLPVVSFNTPDECTTAKEQKMLKCRNIVVEGWYVRFYDLFMKYKPEIKKLFEFKQEIDNKTKELIRKEADGYNITLGLHIRRGDYKTWKDGKFFYNDDDYTSFVLRFSTSHPDSHICVFICGNDPTIDNDYYSGRLKGIKTVFARGNAAEDLCLLSKCDYIIGPPSTFSLVASMYNDRPLCWVYGRDAAIAGSDFKYFDQLFRCIE